MKVAVVSGGFDPIHSGHIDYLKYASSLGDILVVALNSDNWLINKKKKFLLPFNERKIILENLSMVDLVIDFDDDDQGSCILGLEKVKRLYPDDEIVFCNGGDRDNQNTLEMSVDGVKFMFGVGGDSKKNSSSWILKDYKFSSEDRIWGKFYDLFFDENVKVKELILYPGKGISYQRHFHRSEIWFVSKGSCIVKFSEDDPKKYDEVTLSSEDIFHVKNGWWHQAYNENNKECHIIEIQYGSKTDEDDIERISFYENNEK